MKFQITVDKDRETGWYVASCPLLPGCISQGENREAALENIREAIEGWLEIFHERLESGEFGRVEKEIEVLV